MSSAIAIERKVRRDAPPASCRFKEFFRTVESDGIMAIINAYFDDSEDGKRERYMAVGGLLGNSLQFDYLDILWNSATYGLAEPFRSTDCETRHGQFSDWEKKDCDALMKQLVEVIIQSKLVGFGSVVPVSEYRSVFPDAKDYDPYFLALRHTIINMAYIGKLGHDDMKLCFEDSTTTSNRAKAIYDEFKEFTEWSWHKNLSGFTTATKKLMALQAADMIAREAYKHADNLGIRKTRKPVKVMNRRLCFHVWDRRTLEHLKQRGGPDNLEALTGWPWDATAPQTIQFFGPTFDLA